MSIVPFSTVGNFAEYLHLGRRTTGTTTTAFFDSKPTKYNVFQGPTNMKQLFYVRPSNVGQTSVQSLKNNKKNGKFEINLVVGGDQTAFVDACTRFDNFVLDAVYPRKAELMPTKADFIESIDALKPLFVAGRFLHKGKMAPDGSSYADTIRLKIVGDWAPYVAELKLKTAVMWGKTMETVDYCVWNDRNPDTAPLAPSDTRFFLWVRTDAATGKDVYSDKVVFDGETRMVGPQDCKPGCLITPIFSMANVYVNEGFGVTANALALYIKPRVEEPSATGAGALTAFFASSVPAMDGAMME